MVGVLRKSVLDELLILYHTYEICPGLYFKCQSVSTYTCIINMFSILTSGSNIDLP
jgi:hypothetical protein